VTLANTFVVEEKIEKNLCSC